MAAIKTIVFLFLILSASISPALFASEPAITFSVKALFKDRAMLEINGVRHILSAGEQSPEGVKLLSSNVNEANIACHGKKYTLYINQSAYSGLSIKARKTEFKIPKKFVPGKTLPSIQKELNGITKYILKHSYNNPVAIKYGQGAVWLNTGNKLLRFDIKKEAWGSFDLRNEIVYKIDKLYISDKSIILGATKLINNKKRTGLFLFDIKTNKLDFQLDRQPHFSEFIGDKFWFLDREKGLGYIYPNKKNKTTSFDDALLYKDKHEDKNKKKNKKKKTRNEKAARFSAFGNSIWYSHSSNIRRKDKKRRLKEVCVSHYDRKRKTIKRFTRQDMNLSADHDCTDIAASKELIWVSHQHKRYGLSVYSTTTKDWENIKSSTNQILVGGNRIMLDHNHLWLISNNQLIGLNTKTLHANIILGEAAITEPWKSLFYVKDGYAWFVTTEATNTKPVRSDLVLYKIPVNPTGLQVSLSKYK